MTALYVNLEHLLLLVAAKRQKLKYLSYFFLFSEKVQREGDFLVLPTNVHFCGDRDVKEMKGAPNKTIYEVNFVSECRCVCLFYVFSVVVGVF